MDTNLSEKQRKALSEAHAENSEYFTNTVLFKALNVRKATVKGYLQADKSVRTVPLGKLFVQLDSQVKWDEKIDEFQTRVILAPAFYLGKKVWILIRFYDFEGYIVNQDILDYEEGKKLWLKNHYLCID